MSEEFMPETQQATIIPDDDQPAPKQKRQLTEAQRLAFLKAREARARNIAIRREQKLAEEATGAPPAKKPRAKKSNKGDAKPVEVKMEIIPPEPPKLDAVDHTEPEEGEVKETAVPATAPTPEDYAALVADIIYNKLTSEPVDPTPPPMPKVRRQRAKKVKPDSEPEPIPEPEPAPVPADDLKPVAPAGVIESKATPAPAPAPRTAFGWM